MSTLKQDRQRSLFIAKGQVCVALRLCRLLMYNVALTSKLRDHAQLAAIELGEALNKFNPEVGWKTNTVKERRLWRKS